MNKLPAITALTCLLLFALSGIFPDKALAFLKGGGLIIIAVGLIALLIACITP